MSECLNKAYESPLTVPVLIVKTFDNFNFHLAQSSVVPLVIQDPTHCNSEISKELVKDVFKCQLFSKDKFCLTLKTHGVMNSFGRQRHLRLK